MGSDSLSIASSQPMYNAVPTSMQQQGPGAGTVLAGIAAVVGTVAAVKTHHVSEAFGKLKGIDADGFTSTLSNSVTKTHELSLIDTYLHNLNPLNWFKGEKEGLAGMKKCQGSPLYKDGDTLTIRHANNNYKLKKASGASSTKPPKPPVKKEAAEAPKGATKEFFRHIKEQIKKVINFSPAELAQCKAVDAETLKSLPEEIRENVTKKTEQLYRIAENRKAANAKKATAATPKAEVKPEESWEEYLAKHKIKTDASEEEWQKALENFNSNASSFNSSDYDFGHNSLYQYPSLQAPQYQAPEHNALDDAAALYGLNNIFHLF